MPKPADQPRLRPHHRLLGLFLIILLGLMGWLLIRQAQANHRETARQAALQPFYDTPPGFAEAKPGTVLRSEPVSSLKLPAGATALRILYRSERADHTPTVSSGMVYLPAATGSSQPVVAWAHGTIGFGDRCAPSRTDDPLADMDWLGGMLDRGWVVTATDYSGLGTAGTSRYLIGADEATDVLNSVRAARQLDPRAGDRFALWGHSQGGHSVLWSADRAASYAPELHLVAAAAGAPAAELGPLFTQQYRGGAAWVIGPDVAETWPSVYPGLDLSAAIPSRNLKVSGRLAQECALQSGLNALIKARFNQQYFSVDPMTIPSWRQAAAEQTPPIVQPGLPLLIVQSLSDQVVLPATTGLLIKQSCAAGTAVETLWLDTVSHQQTAVTAGPTVTQWLTDRFAGRPSGSSCAQPLPVVPAST